MGCWRKFLVLLQRCISFLVYLKIHTEPIILVMAACNSAIQVVNPTLSQDKMKRTYPMPADMDPSKYTAYISKWMVYWDQQYSYINIPVSCIMGIIFGGYSDRHGRKIPMLVGLISVMISTSLKMLMYSKTTDWPLAVNYPLATFCGLFGDFSLTMTCVNSYLTDQFPDKKQLSVRMVIVSIIFSLGNLGGAQLADQLLKIVSKIALLGIALGGTLVAFIYGVVVLKKYKPTKKRILFDAESENGEEATEERDYAETVSLLQTIKESFLSIWESVKIFIVKREGHKRLFLYVCFLANFLDQFVFGEEKSLIGTYTKLPPFSWSTHDYAIYKTWRPIAQILGMLFGLAFLKKLLKLRDTTCICLAIGSMGLCALVIGLARVSWLIYASLAPGAFHGLLNPLTYTFMSCVVEQNEIGKAYAISSIAQQLAGFAQSLILQNIYKATVDWYMGFVWLLMAGVSGVAMLLYVFVGFVAKRENVG